MQRFGMAGVGEAHDAGFPVGHEVKRGGKHRRAGVFKDVAQIGVQFAQKHSGIVRERFEFLDERANHGGDEAGAHAVAGDIANEHADLRFRKRRHAEEIAADGFRRMIAVRELKRALFRRNVLRKRRVLLQKHRELDFARHVQIFLHDGIFRAQLFTTARQFGARLSDLLLGAFFFRDVPEDALQSDDFSVNSVQRRFDNLDKSILLSQRMMFLGDFVSLAGFHDALVIALVFFGQFLREKIEVRFAEDVLQPAVIMIAVLLIGESEPSFAVFAEDVLRHRLDQRMVERF